MGGALLGGVVIVVVGEVASTGHAPDATTNVPPTTAHGARMRKGSGIFMSLAC